MGAFDSSNSIMDIPNKTCDVLQLEIYRCRSYFSWLQKIEIEIEMYKRTYLYGYAPVTCGTSTHQHISLRLCPSNMWHIHTPAHISTVMPQ